MLIFAVLTIDVLLYITTKVTELVIFYNGILQIKDKTIVNKINQEQNTDRKTRFCNGGIK